MNNTLKYLIILLLPVVMIGCSSIKSKSPTDLIGYTQSGKASFYADKFESRKTASGELYRQSLKTVAHKSLPFGTQLKVTNRANGKSVVVRVNDRGPFVAGRIIDLSKSAFSVIGHTSSGLIPVQIEVIK